MSVSHHDRPTLVILAIALIITVLIAVFGEGNCSGHCRFGKLQWVKYYGCMCVEKPTPAGGN